MRLGKVEFSFENCEVVTIPGEYFVDFYLDDFHTCFRRVAINAIEKIDTVGTIVMSIHKDGNLEYNAPWGETSTTFRRIGAYDDITHIRFFLDGKEYEYSVKWGENDEWDSSRQCSCVSSFGHLYLVVADNPKAAMTEYFPKENIEDEDWEDYHMEIWRD